MRILEELRPEVFDDIAGQKHLLGADSVFRRLVDDGNFDSIILIGPPGTGKTTLAEIIGKHLKMPFVSLHAATAGTAEIKQVMESAAVSGKILLFLDELHRFNKNQQVLLLNLIDSGHAKLIGASTENPYHNLIHPLRSRSFVFNLERLGKDDIMTLYGRAVEYFKRRYDCVGVKCEQESLNRLMDASDGDCRRFLSLLELSAIGGKFVDDVLALNIEGASEHTAKGRYNTDEHYNMLSAMIKSIRGTDPDSALLWGFTLLESGMEPEAIFRRLLISASEDIGNAFPDAVSFAHSGYENFMAVGRPEGDIILAHVITYLASCPKSNRSYNSMWAVKKFIGEQIIPVPEPLRTDGEGYIYPFDRGGFVKQEYGASGKVFYDPSNAGFESKLAERLKKLHEGVKVYGKSTGKK